MTFRRQWEPAALFLVLALVSAGCVRTAEGPQEERRNPFFLAGKERLQAMDYQGAAESFERALQDDPRSVLTHFELGVIYDTHLADYPAALYHYNKALKLRPTGYPADTIRYRIPACRQELVKVDTLAVLNPSALREIEKLREANQELRRQIGELMVAARVQGLAGTSPTPGASSANPSSTGGRASGAHGAAGVSTGVHPSVGATSAAPGRTPGTATRPVGAGSASSGGVRTHTLRPGETFAKLSRQYNVPITAIVEANRGLDPKRLHVGQAIRVPSR